MVPKKFQLYSIDTFSFTRYEIKFRFFQITRNKDSIKYVHSQNFNIIFFHFGQRNKTVAVQETSVGGKLVVHNIDEGS